MNYSLISYLPSGDEFCMGHVVESWGSEHSMHFAFSVENAAKEAARLDFEETDRGIQNSGWEHTLLMDGVPAEEKGNNHIETFDALHQGEYQNLIEAKKIEDAAKREQKRVEREDKKRIATIEKEKREREKLSELKAKYETI